MKLNFTIFGVKFEIDYVFASLIVIYIAIDRTGILLPLLVGILIHEFSHLLFILLFKSKIKAVKLKVGAISVEYSDICDANKKIIALFAGPFSNVALAIFFKVLKNDTIFVLNAVIAIFNLLPLDGLDGGAIAYELLISFFAVQTVKKVMMFISITLLTTLSLSWLLFFKNNLFILIMILYLFTPFIFKKILKDKHL